MKPDDLLHTTCVFTATNASGISFLAVSCLSFYVKIIVTWNRDSTSKITFAFPSLMVFSFLFLIIIMIQRGCCNHRNSALTWNGEDAVLGIKKSFWLAIKWSFKWCLWLSFLRFLSLLISMMKSVFFFPFHHLSLGSIPQVISFFWENRRLLFSGEWHLLFKRHSRETLEIMVYQINIKDDSLKKS